MKIKKKIWGCLLSLLCIFMLVLPVMASESQETDSEIPAVTSEDLAVPTEIPAIPEERQKPLLVDDAGLLTEEESSALLNKLEDISQKYENEVGIVTVNSLEGKQPRHMLMTTMITMATDMEKTMTVCFF